MDRFVVFLCGVYGKSVPTLINPIFNSMAKHHPGVEDFVIPDTPQKYCHVMTENDGEILAQWVVKSIYDLGIQTVFIFDCQTNALNLHKGNGLLEDLIETHYEMFEREYQRCFNRKFDFLSLADVRILLRTAQQN